MNDKDKKASGSPGNRIFLRSPERARGDRYTFLHGDIAMHLHARVSSSLLDLPFSSTLCGRTSYVRRDLVVKRKIVRTCDEGQVMSFLRLGE